ncbi:MAG TPA: NAD-dependent succinate-semialdehyde dehydrogenase [Usitatibacter sp.]|nr:NAD-dependent succinate-semialdehyde dehydrogenase [Usitatibacter sp.]
MDVAAINPATGQTVKIYRETTQEEVAAAIAKAHEAWGEWRARPFAERARLMQRCAGILRARQESLARLMATEMGKPVKQGAAEAEKCAWACEFYAANAERMLQPEDVATEAKRSYVAFQPLGVVLAVMPWNFPLWQVYRFAAPGLMAGNVAVLKHASNVPGCALAIDEMFREAGFPEGVFRALLVGSKAVGAIIDHPRVRAVTLTGSTPAGRSVAMQGGHAIKKTVLELGGSDAYVVLEDADLDHAARTCVQSRLVNSGQSCIAAKRFIVASPVAREFTERFVERMKQAKVGDPFDEATDVGPLARQDLRDHLHVQVRRSKDRGARVLLGGEVPAGDGAWYPPTVLADVKPGMPAFDEELFGPAAAIVEAKDENDAIELANRTQFGLGGAVFTKDLARGERLARALECGFAAVNTLVASDPRLPFGGVKCSGYGRELGVFGIREFVNVKTVYLQAA